MIQGLGRVVAQTGVGVAWNAKALKDLSSHIEQAYDGMEKVSLAAGQIQTGIEKLAGKANQILQEQVHDTARGLNVLTDKILDITRITQVVNGISEQTKLLALNTAIEAAHAGLHGRGFAVVATEVQKLAEHSWTQTSEISNLVDEITALLQPVQGAVAKSQELGDLASQHTTALGQSLGEIRQLARESSEHMQQVSLAVHEQTSQMETLSAHSRYTTASLNGSSPSQGRWSRPPRISPRCPKGPTSTWPHSDGHCLLPGPGAVAEPVERSPGLFRGNDRPKAAVSERCIRVPLLRIPGFRHPLPVAVFRCPPGSAQRL